MAGDDAVERTELEAVLEARRELGPSYDAALVDSFSERVEAAIASRVADDAARRRGLDRSVASAGPRQLALGIVSCVAGIPISAIALAVPEPNAGATGLVAMLIGWGGLVGINVAHAVQGRPRH